MNKTKVALRTSLTITDEVQTKTILSLKNYLTQTLLAVIIKKKNHLELKQKVNPGLLKRIQISIVEDIITKMDLIRSMGLNS